jgi:hypothetical protein
MINRDFASSNSDNGYDEFTETHPQGANDEETAAAGTIDKLDTHNSHYGVYYISNDSEQNEGSSVSDRSFLLSVGLRTER